MADLWNSYNYTDILRSEGYEVDFAVMTTYSLDFQSLLSVPFALGQIETYDGAANVPPHILLERVNKSADKFVVFYNAGCIPEPEKASKVYALLAKSVVQIKMPKQEDSFINFHPKVWVVKERDKETGKKTRIKVVVLSRNLTLSQDIDVVCELTGAVEVDSPENEKHKPLADFIKWLAEKSQSSKQVNKILQVANDVLHVSKFDLDGSDFCDYDFFPMGICGGDGKECLDEITSNAKGLMVVSPFIDIKTLERLSNCCKSGAKTLITRHNSLTANVFKLFPQADNGGVYVPKEGLQDSEEWEKRLDLHEKVYFVSNDNGNFLYLGSTNASNNGFYRNVEFILRLKFAPYKMSYDKFRAELINDSKDCMFCEVSCANDETQEVDPKSNDELTLRKAIAQITGAEVSSVPGGGYSVLIETDGRANLVQGVTLYPLGCKGREMKLGRSLSFDGLHLDELTEFYVITLGNLRRVIKIETKGLPVGDRDDAIFRSLIDSRPKFEQYVAMLISDNPELDLANASCWDDDNGALASDAGYANIPSTALYEIMVKAAYANRDLTDVKELIDKLADDKNDIVPKEFKNLCDVCQQASNKIKKFRK